MTAGPVAEVWRLSGPRGHRRTSGNGLSAVPERRAARALMVTPDRAQALVRMLALEAGRLVYTAAPGLAAEEPFHVLDPRRIPAPAAADDEAAAAAPLTGLGGLRAADLIACGSVAVDRHGARPGKGSGYTGIELALLTEAGAAGPRTAFATTVHDLQVADEDQPQQDHDIRVGLVVTPGQVIRCGSPGQPARIDWQQLSPGRREEIPVLRRRQPRRPGPRPAHARDERAC